MLMSNHLSQKQLKKENKMKEETFTLSESATKLCYILNGINYAYAEITMVKKEELKKRLRETSEFLYQANIKETNDVNIFTLTVVLEMSKLIGDDEMLIKVFNYLLSVVQSDEMIEYLNLIFSSSINIFTDTDLLFFTFMHGMGVVNVGEIAQENKLLEVDLINSPMFVKTK